MRAAVVLLALFPVIAAALDDLAPLSDEFNDASTLMSWQRVYVAEGWNANQLERQDINTSRSGRMFMMPFTSTWYNDYRGELTFKEVQGDFVVTTSVEVSSRAGSGPPRSDFSLGGIMIRAPRQITPATWRPGGENYIFLSIGAATPAGFFQFEVKTTTNSNSDLHYQPTPSGRGSAVIQVAWIGPHFILMRNDGTGWVVHQRYYRPEMPLILQAGMTTYTDYSNASRLTPFAHNSTVIHTGNPDLIAMFDYFRFQRPVIPAALVNANFSNAASVSDAQLLTFLGENAARRGRRHAVRH